MEVGLTWERTGKNSDTMSVGFTNLNDSQSYTPDPLVYLASGNGKRQVPLFFGLVSTGQGARQETGLTNRSMGNGLRVLRDEHGRQDRT